MKLKQRIACLALVLALLCPLAVSCATAEKPSPTLQTETEEKAEEVSENTENSEFVVAEFLKDLEFTQKISSAKLRFSGDCAFQLFCNNEIVATGKNALARDFQINTKIGLPGNECKDFSSNEKVEVLTLRIEKLLKLKNQLEEVLKREINYD